MKIEKFEYIDVELEGNFKGYIIRDEEEYIVHYENDYTTATKRYNNIKELVADLIHYKTMYYISNQLLSEAVEENEELEAILKDHFEE